MAKLVTAEELNARSVAKSAGFRPLNPVLYSRLKAVCGQVKLSSQWAGVRFRSETQVGADERKREYVLQPGESYHVCCPYCGDTRFRLSVNHAYLTELRSGRYAYFLAHCWNETACLEDYETRQDFQRLLIAGRPADTLSQVELNPGRDVDPLTLTAELPGMTKRLADLPDTNPSRAYVLSRGLDPDRLSRAWGVSACLTAFEHAFLRNFVIIPVWFKSKLVGWQGRYPGDIGWGKGKKVFPPKYFTMPGLPKSRIFGNFDMAAKYRFPVLVEGWFDVFGGAGPHGLLTFGSTLSPDQIVLLRATWPKGPIVWAYDPDVFNKEETKERAARMFAALLEAFPRNVVKVDIPEGADPGSLARPVFRALADEAAARHGITLDWRPR